MHCATLIIYLDEDDGLERVKQKVEDAALEMGYSSDRLSFSLQCDIHAVSEDEDEADEAIAYVLNGLAKRRRAACGWHHGEEGVGQTIDQEESE